MDLEWRVHSVGSIVDLEPFHIVIAPTKGIGQAAVNINSLILTMISCEMLHDICNVT